MSAGLAGCRAAMRTGSRSFAAAGRLLPARVRDPAAVLYAFCRAADDAVDGAAPACKADALQAVRARLDAVYGGTPADPADRLLADVVARGGVPRSLPDALLAGFAADVAGQRYDDLPALHAYALQVAGTVGLMMALMMGVRTPEGLAAAANLGCAMQLTNIARDVGEDARAGRIYLPLDWLREARIDPERWLRAPVHSPALAEVVRRLLAEADRLYAAAEPGIGHLAPRCRPAIRAASRFYRAIGAAVARNDFDAVSRRAAVPARRKLLLALGCLAPSAGGGPPAPASAAVLALVGPLPAAAAPHRWWQRLDDRAAWVAELFIRLAEADRRSAQRPGHAERQHRLDPGRREPAQVHAFVDGGATALPQ